MHLVRCPKKCEPHFLRLCDVEIYMGLLQRCAGLGGHPSLDAKLTRGVDPPRRGYSNLKLFMFSIVFWGIWNLRNKMRLRGCFHDQLMRSCTNVFIPCRNGVSC
jgi:hypothetical protein